MQLRLIGIKLFVLKRYPLMKWSMCVCLWHYVTDIPMILKMLVKSWPISHATTCCTVNSFIESSARASPRGARNPGFPNYHMSVKSGRTKRERLDPCRDDKAAEVWMGFTGPSVANAVGHSPATATPLPSLSGQTEEHRDGLSLWTDLHSEGSPTFEISRRQVSLTWRCTAKTPLGQ